MTQLEIIAEKSTAIIFLNAQWIAHLAKLLQKHELYGDAIRQLVEHARNENKLAFNSINELRKQAQADTIPRATVAAALLTLEHGLRPELFHTRGMYEAAMQMLAETRAQLGIPQPEETK